MNGVNAERLDLSSKRIFQLSWPVMISMMAQNLIGVIDTAFLTRLGEVEVGAAAMASLVYFSIYTIGFGLATGTQIMVSHRYGSGRDSEIGHVLGQSLKILFIAALLLIFLGSSFGKLLFGGLLSSSAVASAATEYWYYRTFGFLFAFMSSGFRSFFVGVSDTKVLTYNAIVMSIVNVLLDYGLIFGNLGMPELGIKGAAIASVAAEIASVFFYLLYIRFRVDRVRFGLVLREMWRHDGTLVKRLLGLSYYLMIQALLSQSGWTVVFFMIESLGERELAIASIIRSLYSILLLPIGSYGTAVRTTVGHIVGYGAFDKMDEYLRTAVKLSFGTMLVLSTLIFIFPEVPLRLFSDDPTLINSAVATLRVICVATLVSSVGNMYFSAVGSTGATKVVFQIEVLNIVFYVIYGAIMVYLLKGTVAMVFTIEIIYYFSAGLMSYRFIKRGKWRELGST